MPNKSKYKMKICTNAKCKKEYELGFWGTGPKYCSRECFFLDRKRLAKIKRGEKKTKFLKATKKKCALCGINVITINGYPARFNGERKRRIRKYCSKRCMVLSQKRGKNKNAKYFTVKIPIYQLGEMLKT